MPSTIHSIYIKCLSRVLGHQEPQETTSVNFGIDRTTKNLWNSTGDIEVMRNHTYQSWHGSHSTCFIIWPCKIVTLFSVSDLCKTLQIHHTLEHFLPLSAATFCNLGLSRSGEVKRLLLCPMYEEPAMKRRKCPISN